MLDVYKGLISALAKNNMSVAKRYAVDALRADKTVRDKSFCARYLDVFEKSESESASESPSEILKKQLPANISGFLIVDDKEVLESRYYLTAESKGLFDKILATQRLSERLNELKLPTLQAIMLYGASGTGKTEFVRYVAYKLNKPFIYVNLSQVLSSYLGNTQKNISSIFNYLNTCCMDCVFLFDEVDAIGMSRGSSNEVGELSRIVISLLQALDSYRGNSLIFGATNRLDILDAALKRRFTTYQEFKYLEAADVYKFVIKYLSELQIKYDEENVRTYSTIPRKYCDILMHIRDSVVKHLMTEKPFKI